ncbi:MAG: hypothetical protein ACYSR6_12130 [Planctomycetota bacterium]
MNAFRKRYDRMSGKERNRSVSSDFSAENIERIVIDVFRRTASTLSKELELICLDHWHEGILRFLFLKEVLTYDDSLTCFVECDRIDLVIRKGNVGAFIEFKFYLHSPKYDPYTGARIGRKGYPSPKNFKEFNKCIDELHRRRQDQNIAKFIVLAYADPVNAKTKTYGGYYDDFTIPSERNINLKTIDSVESIRCGKTNSMITLKLFEIT